MAIKLTVHALNPNGVDSLSGKEGEVLVVSFDDGTVSEAALNQKSLMQLLRMKLAQPAKKPEAKPIPAAVPVAGNGPAK